MKKILVISIILLVLPFTAYAENQVERKTVEQLIDLTNGSAMIDSMNTQIDKMLSRLPAQLGINKDEQYIFDKYIKKVNASVRQEITWEKMKEPIIQIYMKHYTQKEIEEILAFYKTETGMALIKKMPLVMQESMQLSQNMFKKIIPEIQKFSKEMQNELTEARNKKNKEDNQEQQQP